MRGAAILAITAGLAFPFMSAVAESDTVSVAGVVVKHEKPGQGKGHERIGGVEVELATDAEYGKVLTADVTTNDSDVKGTYNLSCNKVNSSVSGLWVRCVNNSMYNYRPVEAPLKPERQGIRRSKPADMEVWKKNTKLRTPYAVAWNLTAIQEVTALDIKLKWVKPANAMKGLEVEVMKVFGRSTIAARDKEAIDAVNKVILEVRNKELLKEPLLGKDEMLRLLNRAKSTD